MVANDQVLAAAAVGQQREAASLLAAGRSSQAWLVEGGPAPMVVRVSIPNSGRRLSYRSEAAIGEQLAALGAPVARWQTVTIDDRECSIGELLHGEAIRYRDTWSTQLVEQVATTLKALHELPASGFGPLVDTDTELRGASVDRRMGIVDRWFHASVWPFDNIDFANHVIYRVAPDIATMVAPLRELLLAAEAGPSGIVHSDLHREHLLVGPSGELTGLLDFGDAFIGAVAWDFALLLWYYGAAVTHRVLDIYGASNLMGDAEMLAIAVGLYKIARQPENLDLIDKLRELTCETRLAHGL